MEAEARAKGERFYFMKVYLWALSYLFKYKFLFLAVLGCSAITITVDLVIPKFIQYLIDEILPQKDEALLMKLLLLLIPMVAVVIIFNAIKNLVDRVITENSGRDLQFSVLAQLRHLGFSYYEKNAVGATLSLFNNELKAVQRIYKESFPKMVQDSIYAVISTVILFTVNVKLALIVIPCFLLYYLIGPRLVRKHAILSREVVAYRKEYDKKLYDSVSSLLELKANDAAQWDRGQLKDRLDLFRNSSVKETRMNVLRGTTRWATVYLGAIVLFIAGAFMVQSNTLTAGQFVAFMMYYFPYVNRLMGFVTTVIDQKILFIQAEKLYRFFRTEPEVTERKNPAVLREIRGDVVFDRVTFRYRDDMPVLTDFSLKVRRGEKLALVGSSGNGKSTVLKLLGRFYDPQQGEIRIDGVPISELSFEQLRGALGFVFQETYLFGTTIRENIRFGNPDATEEQITEAAKAAYAHDFIMSSPNGYDTFVGERGIKLSGGQKQRIAIARMILKNPAIIILDEATSALDNISEKEVQLALDELMAGRTTITVAHRLSTIKHYDCITVMDQGRAAEAGSYEELMRRRGLLYHIVEGGTVNA